MMDFYSLMAFVLVVFLAFANGANDVSKGIATLVGSGVTSYRKAILWGTAWTMVGGCLAVTFSLAIVQTFSDGILAGVVSNSPRLPLSVIIGATVWVLLASRFGLPVSTTHAIIGAVCGATFFASGVEGVQWDTLLHKVVYPLLLSPVLALALTFLSLPIYQRLLSGWPGYCVCVRPVKVVLAAPQGGKLFRILPSEPEVQTFSGSVEQCQGESGVVFTVTLNSFHWFTSGLVSLARGLNDAPKIVALMVALGLLGWTGLSQMTTTWGFVLVALGMGAGSWAAGLRVTEVLAERVVRMDALHGFTANITTAILVIFSTKLGFPVSTTHVSTGAILGTGLHQGSGHVRWNVVGEILLAWIVTIPGTGLLAAGTYWFLTHVSSDL